MHYTRFLRTLLSISEKISHKKHPAFKAQLKYNNIEVIFYNENINLEDLLIKVKQNYDIKHLIIESGGTMNAFFIRQGLIDHALLIVAPLFVGGHSTPSLIDGPSLQTEDDLFQLKALKLIKCTVLNDSYIRLDYDVINETIIDPII